LYTRDRVQSIGVTQGVCQEKEIAGPIDTVGKKLALQPENPEEGVSSRLPGCNVKKRCPNGGNGKRKRRRIELEELL